MSADAETDPRGLSAIVDGDPAAGSPGGGGEPGAAGQGAGPPPDAAGRLLGRLSVLPALLAMAWLLAGLPLLLAGRFTLVLMLVVSLPLAALLLYLGLRWVPGRWQTALPAPGPRRARTPWWAVAGVIAVAAAFGAHQLIYHSQQIIVERDPASYMQFAYWIAHHGSLPIPQARAAFGGTHQLLHFGSLAFYQVGGSVVPQFMAGLPMVVAAGFWAGGVGAAACVPALLGACAVLTFGGLAVRPYLQPERHRSPVQAAAHVRVNPPSVFWAMSLDWVFWYIWVPAVLLGTLGAALLARRCLRGRAPAWTLPLMVFAWIIVTVLARPAIVPNQPWASRRLVPGVLPGLILLAVWAVAWLVGWLRQRGYDRVIQAGLVTVCSVALVLPAAVTSFGLGVATGGPLGVRPVAHGLALKRTYAGEIAAVDRMCAAIPPGSSVVIIDGQTAARFSQVVRGMCGEPTAWMDRRPASVRQVISAIRQAGRRPVLLGVSRSQVVPYGPAREVLALRTREDARLQTEPPMITKPRPITVWMTEPAP